MFDVPDDIQEAVAKKFSDSYPEYFGSENNAAMMRQAVEELCEAGYAFSGDTLAVAYHGLNAGGHFEQPEAEMVEASNEEMTYARHIDSLANNADRMTDLELEKSLRSAGIYVSSRSTI